MAAVESYHYFDCECMNSDSETKPRPPSIEYLIATGSHSTNAKSRESVYTLCLKKTSLTFLAITRESIDGFL